MRQEPSVELCARTCGAYCCRNGVWHLTTAEMRRVRALPGGKALKVFALGVNAWEVDVAYQRGHKCPFLGEDNLCTVYEARPEGCRTYPRGPELGCWAWPLEAERAGADRLPDP